MFGLTKGKLGTMGKFALAVLGVVLAKGAIDAFFDYDKSSKWKSAIAVFAGAIAIGVLGGFVVGKGKAAFAGNMLVAGAAVAGLNLAGQQVSEWGADLGASLGKFGGSTMPASPGAGAKPVTPTAPSSYVPPSQQISVATPPVAPQPTTIVQQAAPAPSITQSLIQYAVPALGQLGSSLISAFAKPAGSSGMASDLYGSGANMATALYG